MGYPDTFHLFGSKGMALRPQGGLVLHDRRQSGEGIFAYDIDVDFYEKTIDR